MAASPVFELFEVICTELAAQPTQILTEDRIGTGLLDDLKEHYDETSDSVAFKKALAEIEVHLAERGAVPPYTVDLQTREFKAVDGEYIEFVAFARNHRSVGGADSKDFEIRTLRRLRKRLTGDLRRVGVPRDLLKTKPQIVAYLKKLGFEPTCFEAHDKDGGLDILWLPPLGAVPMRPIVSVQCKNSFFDETEANKSTGRAHRTLTRHTHLRSSHLKFVVFNDYIDKDRFEGRAVGWAFMPLGLTDLANVSANGIDDIL
jgi:hypothetical protein